MRKVLLIGLLFAGACKSHTTELPSTRPEPSTPGSSATGANTPRLAVAGFLSATHAQDMQALSGIWGNKDGPVRESKSMTRDEMEQREIVLIRCFRNDSHRVLTESPATDGERVLEVEITQGTSRSTTRFFTAKSGDRWYVRSADMDPKRCASK